MERLVRHLKIVQQMAGRKGLSVEEYLEKFELGETVLELWEETGQPKEPEEVLRPDMAEIIQAMRNLIDKKGRSQHD